MIFSFIKIKDFKKPSRASPLISMELNFDQLSVVTSYQQD